MVHARGVPVRCAVRHLPRAAWARGGALLPAAAWMRPLSSRSSPDDEPPAPASSSPPPVASSWRPRWSGRSTLKMGPAAVPPLPPPSGPRSPRDSLVSETLPLLSSPERREDYVSPFGAVRVGKVLEDLDALAGKVAYRHCGVEPARGLTIVTASVDRIDLINRIPLDKDLDLKGWVTWVGTSSMEVSLQMETTPPPEPSREANTAATPAEASTLGTPILAAKFTMVARDAATGKATPAPPLRLETEEERRLFRLASEQKARKKVEKQTGLDKVPPSVEEMYLVHDLYKESQKYGSGELPDHTIWASDTEQRSLVMCMPQDRNIHNFIFGGYLMRLAFELAHNTGVIFARSGVHFVALDDITFRRPVPIGSILALTARVVYATGGASRSLQVRVRADVMDPLQGTRDMSNEFFFTFVAPAGGVPRVLPRSYEEAMQYVDGKRRKDAWIQASQHNTALFGSERLKAWGY